LAVHRVETGAGVVQIVALPWLRRSALLALPEYRQMSAEQARRAIQDRAAQFVQDAAADLDPSLPAILTAHLSVEGATYGSERSVGVAPTQEIVDQIEKASLDGAIVRLIVETTPEVDAFVDYATVRRALRYAYCIAGVRRDVARADRRGGVMSGVEQLTPVDALERYLAAREVAA